MKKSLMCCGVIAVFFVLACASANAQDAAAVSSADAQQGAAPVVDYRQEIADDQAALQAQKDAIKTGSSEAKEQEKALRDQIRTAQESGDKATAQELRGQLKTMHQENVQGRDADRQELNQARQELNADKKKARTDKDRDGVVSDQEQKAFEHRRADRNKDGAVDATEHRVAETKKAAVQTRRNSLKAAGPAARGRR